MSDFRYYRPYKLGEFIVVWCDTAAGGGDYCAGQFLSKNYRDFPTVYHSKGMATEMTPQIHDELERIYDATHVRPCVAFERNNGGAFELERLAALNRLNKYVIYKEKTHVGETTATKESVKLGWTTNSATRPMMLQQWKEAFDQRLPVIYDKPTINEHASFINTYTSSTWKAQAERGAHDDLVMSSAGAWQLSQTESPTASVQVLDMGPSLELDEYGLY